MWERVLHMRLHRRDQPFELAAFPSKGSVILVYSKRLLRLVHATLPPARAPFESQSWGLLSAITTRLSASQLSTTYLYRANTLILLAYMYDLFDNHITCDSL